MIEKLKVVELAALATRSHSWIVKQTNLYSEAIPSRLNNSRMKSYLLVKLQKILSIYPPIDSLANIGKVHSSKVGQKRAPTVSKGNASTHRPYVQIYSQYCLGSIIVLPLIATYYYSKSLL